MGNALGLSLACHFCREILGVLLTKLLSGGERLYGLLGVDGLGAPFCL